MRQFIIGNAAAWAALALQARGACMVFPDEEMPTGAPQRQARVGFEHGASGHARLLVDRQFGYQGADPEVRAWLASGERTFPSFAALRAWVTGRLAGSYPMAPAGAPQAPMPTGVVTTGDGTTFAEAPPTVSNEGATVLASPALMAEVAARVRALPDEELVAIVLGAA